MSAHLAPFSRPTGLAQLAPNLVMALRLAWRRFQRAYVLALRAETSRRNLSRLDARMLSDIGINLVEEEPEVEEGAEAKPKAEGEEEEGVIAPSGEYHRRAGTIGEQIL